MIRIGSSKPKDPAPSQKKAPPNGQKRTSVTTNSSGSPDSASSAGGKFQYEPPLSSASSGEPGSISLNSDLQPSPTHSHGSGVKPVPTIVLSQHIRVHSDSGQQHERKVARSQEDLTEKNK